MFQEDVSPKDMHARDARPFEYFKLFMTMEKTLISHLCKLVAKLFSDDYFFVKNKG